MKFKQYLTEKHTDWVYSNKDDTVRVRVFKRSGGWWDYDVFKKSKGGYSHTFSTESADTFRTKKEALTWANKEFGPLRLNNKLDNLGW